MTLNSSGPISLAGSTAGQSIALELGLGATAQISLNDAAVRSLAGIATGAITMPTNFWGKSVAPNVFLNYAGASPLSTSGVTNKVARIDANAALISAETTLGTARHSPASAPLDNIYVGVGNSTSLTNYGSTCTRINPLGAIVGSETSVGTATAGGGGGLCGYTGGTEFQGTVLYHWGFSCNGCGAGRLKSVNSSGAAVRAETNVGSFSGAEYAYPSRSGAGGSTATNMLDGGTTYTRTTMWRINAGGTVSSTSTGAGTNMVNGGQGPTHDNVNTYFGGNNTSNVTYLNRFKAVVNSTGALSGSVTSVGTGRASVAGGRVGDVGLFLGGQNNTSGAFNSTTYNTRLSATGALVGQSLTLSGYTSRVYVNGAHLKA